jgi:outer membrane protein TolC
MVMRLSIILTLFALESSAQTELDNYLVIAATNNPGLKAKFASYNAALERVPQVNALPDPLFSFGYFISPIETRVGPQQAKLGVSQMFPWFGSLKAQEDVVIQRAKSKYEAFEEAKSILFFNVKSAYFDVYFIKKGIDIMEENIRILSIFQQLSIIKIETGKASVVDELRVEMEINELKNQLAYLKDSKIAIEVKFNNLLNREEMEAISVPDTLWDETLLLSKDALMDSISIKNHLIKQIEHKILSWQNEEIASRKTGAPQISLGLDYSIIGKSDNPNLGSSNGQDAIMPKIGITIPIYRKKYTAIVREAAFELESNEFSKEDKINELNYVFEKAYKDYKDANRRISLFQRQMQLANKSLNILMTSYSSDGKNFEELLRMERKVLKFSLEYDKARADKNASVAFIDYLLGH